MVFMDHRGTLFHDDLQSFEEMKLLQDGCRVLADNTLKPGAPLFLWHVSRSPSFTTDLVVVPEFGLGHQVLQDWVAVSCYDLHHAGSSSPPPPHAIAELSERCDALRRRSLAGGLTSEDWAKHAEEMESGLSALGIEATVASGERHPHKDLLSAHFKWRCRASAEHVSRTAFKLHYRRTFLDTDEEPWHSPRLRPASCPPNRAQRDAEEEEESESQKHYLDRVVREASQFLPRFSRGSVGHPEVCRRPCVYLATGHCAHREACLYCHAEHDGPRARPDKKQRALLQGLMDHEVVDIVLPHLQARAEMPELQGKAYQLLFLVEGLQPLMSPSGSSSSPTSSPSVSPMADGKLKSLNKTLQRMTFSSLVTLMCESFAEGNFRDQLLQSLEDVRAQCANA
ncbi:PGC [Symbiodinium natans]|uniref:PGC protein n=1 Tax=Symbiodinium natans TaxID=878477 RepID=A0A812VGC0_9DINO|nr:PGC [Symbiodinium natans]